MQTDAGAAILDEMKLELTDMKISKVVVIKTVAEGGDKSTAILGKRKNV